MHKRLVTAYWITVAALLWLQVIGSVAAHTVQDDSIPGPPQAHTVQDGPQAVLPYLGSDDEHTVQDAHPLQPLFDIFREEGLSFETRVMLAETLAGDGYDWNANCGDQSLLVCGDGNVCEVSVVINCDAAGNCTWTCCYRCRDVAGNCTQHCPENTFINYPPPDFIVRDGNGGSGG